MQEQQFVIEILRGRIQRNRPKLLCKMESPKWCLFLPNHEFTA